MFKYQCELCNALKDISGIIIKKDILLIATRQKPDGKTSLKVPSLDGGSNYIYALGEKETRELIKDSGNQVIKIYCKNRMMTGSMLATKIWMGDYAAEDGEGVLDFEELGELATGINRVAVLRADVDNLGMAFIGGFIREKEGGGKDYRYQTISRTAALSRQLSLFFKFHVNRIMERKLDGGLTPVTLSGATRSGKRNATIVYAGGDDMFIVGAWDEVVELALDLQKTFEKFSGQTLTFSAGIGIFSATYPLSRMAADTEDLEREAKSLRSEKNAVALFGLEILNGRYKARHKYPWQTFEKVVVGEKLRVIQSMFCKTGREDHDYGMSFLYRLMHLISGADSDSINIARYAYLLGRMAPGRNSPAEEKDMYSSFSKKMYGWVLDSENRRQLLTAITIYIYLNRVKKNA